MTEGEQTKGDKGARGKGGGELPVRDSGGRGGATCEQGWQ
jgi:hypothetical protein